MKVRATLEKICNKYIRDSEHDRRTMITGCRCLIPHLILNGDGMAFSVSLKAFGPATKS